MDAGHPTDVRTVAVAVEDVVAAHEHNRGAGDRAVLRLTPPFHGRMRARLHVEVDEGYDAEPSPVHVPPERFLTGDPPAYPRADETGEQLRADPDVEYSVADHYDRHADAVAAWREAVRCAVGGSATLPTPSGPHRVDVVALGGE